MTRTGWPSFAPLVRARDFGFVDRPRLTESPVFAAASTAAMAGLILIDPSRLSGGPQAAYRMATAAFAGGYVSATTPVDVPMSTEMRAAVGLATGGLTLGLADQFEALDARLTDWLSAHGVTRPRWVLAGLGAAGVLAGYAWDRTELRRIRKAIDAAPEPADEPARPLTSQVRELVEALLVDGVPGVESLRQQLQSAHQQDQGEGFSSDIWFVMDGDTPRAVPHTQRWPVQGRFFQDGVELSIELQIHQGRADMLSIMVPGPVHPDDWSEEYEERGQDAIASLTAWPDASSVSYVTDSAD